MAIEFQKHDICSKAHTVNGNEYNKTYMGKLGGLGVGLITTGFTLYDEFRRDISHTQEKSFWESAIKSERILNWAAKHGKTLWRSTIGAMCLAITGISYAIGAATDKFINHKRANKADMEATE